MKVNRVRNRMAADLRAGTLKTRVQILEELRAAAQDEGENLFVSVE